MTAAPAVVPLAECPLCGSNKRRLRFAAADRVHGVPGRYRYEDCLGCGSVYQSPRVAAEDLHRCYPADYYTHGPVALRAPVAPPQRLASGARDSLRAAVVAAVGGERRSPLARILVRSRWIRERAYRDAIIDELLPRGRSRRALDVGCGAGALLVALSSVGWTAEGVETDPAAAKVARAASGCPVQQGDFLTVPLAPGTYGLVVLHHAFEHLAEPRGALVHFRKLLAADGRLVLIFPNVRALGVRLYGDDWFPWEVPRHLVFPSPNGMRAAAAAAGLRVTSARTSARYAAAFLAHSRAVRRHQPPALDSPAPTPADLAWGVLERLAVSLGFPVGEESFVVLAGTDRAQA